MMLRADFGWIVFVFVLFWLFQVLRSGARSSGRTGGPTRRPPAGSLEGTQREGVELEELFRQLQQRLGGVGKPSQPRPKVEVKQPADVRPVAAAKVGVRREPAKPEQQVVEAGNQGGSGQPTRAAAGARLTARQLRDAVLWREILGQPKGLQ
jgi:hypothetical protein